jgi:competence protein ComEA
MLRRFNAFAFAALTAFSALAALTGDAFAAVDANKASQSELQSIKGIGPALSSRILEARKSAAFKDWGDLVDRVSGVGPGNAARFSQAGLTVGDKPYGSAAPTAVSKGTKPEVATKTEDKPAARARADK